MDYPGRRAEPRRSGFLSKLARDTAGNTMALAAAFAIPLAALAGSAVDMSRVYLVKVRLQQACDAGVLAGRKVMTQVTGTTLETAPENAAQAFFKNNLPTGWMGTSGRSLTTGRLSNGQVTGRAQVTVPMAIMGMFGFGAMTQTVNCSARLDIGDSDIMFVLDTTGSMACDTGEGCSSTGTWARQDVPGTTGYFIREETGSKISQLRAAVKLFRQVLEKKKPAAAHIRYGFVPYSASVNVGQAIRDKDPNYLVNTWTYPSRVLSSDSSHAVPTDTNSTNYSVASNASSGGDAGKYYHGDVLYSTGTGNPASSVVALPRTIGAITYPKTKAGCLAQETRTAVISGTTTNFDRGTWPSGGEIVTRRFPVWASNTCTVYSWTVKPLWSHQNVSLDVSTFKTGAAVTDPTKLDGSTAKWQGCIEERDTTAGASTFTTNNLPADLNPDTTPTTDSTKWRPLWPEVVYYRNGTSNALYSGQYNRNNANAGSSDAPGSAAANYSALMDGTDSGDSLGMNQLYGCNAVAKTLKEYNTAAEITEFEDYLDGTATTVTATKGNFRASGRTYHDVGMIWGLRLISPDGPWASTTQPWGSNSPPNRYIVFMTDGLLNTTMNVYGMYGIEKLARRVTNNSGTSDTAQRAFHAARFQAVCNAAKAKQITVFVVAFDVGTTVPTALENCATPSYAYAARAGAASTDADSLENAFRRIALQIARLRLQQ